MKMKIIQQLELGYVTESFSADRKSKIANRKSNASFWFARMRQIVDRAIDWPPAPAPRAEQILFPESTAAPVTHTTLVE